MIASFVRLREPLNDLLKLYAKATHSSKNAAIVRLLETHPSLVAFYERLTRDGE